MKYKLDFYTQYHQFYLCDSIAPGETASRKFWTGDAYNDRLAIENGTIGIGTECYGPVKAEIELLDDENVNFDIANYDHIVEGGLVILSETMILKGCPIPDPILKIQIEPGNYRVRIYSSNLKSVEGDEGDDYYQIEIWPNSNMERKVLKRFISN
jgi:hypothetical protein